MTLNIPFTKVYVVLRLLEPENIQGRNKLQMFVNISDRISRDSKTDLDFWQEADICVTD